MRVQHAGRPHDLTIVAKPISDYAEWTIEERDRGGLRRRKYAHFGGDARSGRKAAGIRLPGSDTRTLLASLASTVEAA